MKYCSANPERETTLRTIGKWRGVWGEKENVLPQILLYQEGYQSNKYNKLTYLPFLPQEIVLVSCQRNKTINRQKFEHFFLHSCSKITVLSINYDANVMMAISWASYVKG